MILRYTQGKVRFSMRDLEEAVILAVPKRKAFIEELRKSGRRNALSIKEAVRDYRRHRFSLDETVSRINALTAISLR